MNTQLTVFFGLEDNPKKKKNLYLAGQIHRIPFIQCSVVFSMYINGGGINTSCGFLKAYA